MISNTELLDEATLPAEDALQLEAMLFARCYWYTLFNKIFGGTPDAATIEQLTSDVARDAIEEYAEASDTMRAFLDFLQQLADQDTEGLLDAARDEYTRVFIGPGALPASPYESPYRDAHDMALFQENTLSVRKCYEIYGLRARRIQAVPDDHVALECAFMAEMSSRALGAFRTGEAHGCAKDLRNQLAFASRHLTGWLDTFATSVRNSKAGAAAICYPQLLEAVAAFVTSDIDFMSEAAYTLENLHEDALAGAGVAPELASAQQALVTAQSLRPFGIEDNELVSIEN